MEWHKFERAKTMSDMKHIEWQQILTKDIEVCFTIFHHHLQSPLRLDAKSERGVVLYLRKNV